MKIYLTLLMANLLAATALAQDADPLAVTLSNGKVVHFQSAEQKEKFEAARAGVASRAALATTPLRTVPPPSAAPQTPPTETPKATPLDLRLGRTALDDVPKRNGVVNVTAPVFTADYYLLAPSTWVGKKVTLAVAYLTRQDGAPTTDGLTRMQASTWNDRPGSGGDHVPGGGMTVLANPETATKLMQQCGTRLVYTGGWRVKITLIRGEITEIKPADGAETSTKAYGFRVAD